MTEPTFARVRGRGRAVYRVAEVVDQFDIEGQAVPMAYLAAADGQVPGGARVSLGYVPVVDLVSARAKGTAKRAASYE